MKADLPSVDPVLVAGDARVAPEAADERRRDIRESRMAMQQDPGLDVPARAQQRDAGAFAARSQGAKCQPSLDGVIRDQARNGHRHIFGERRLADEGAHEFGSRGLEHELQFREPRERGCCHDAGRSDVIRSGRCDGQFYDRVLNEI